MTLRFQSHPKLPSSASACAATLRDLVGRRRRVRKQAATLEIAQLGRVAANRTTAASGLIVNVCRQVADMSGQALSSPAAEQVNTAPHVEAVALLRAVHAEAKSQLATPQDIEKALRAYTISALIQELKAAGR